MLTKTLHGPTYTARPAVAAQAGHAARTTGDMTLLADVRRPVVGAAGLLTLAAAILVAAGARAASISVVATQLLVPPSVRQTAMTVRAEGAARSVVQMRVPGGDKSTPANQLTETAAVAASPR